MIKYRLISISLLCIAFFSSCDIISGPYLQEGSNNPDDTTKLVRKVLIEDYTGFLCQNCPEAAETAEAIKENNKGRVFVLAVHAGPWAVPNAKHTYDFRTTAGTALDDFFKIGKIGNPNGMVSRIKYNGFQIIQPNSWEAAFVSIKDDLPKMTIDLSTSFNQTTKEITVTIDIEYLQDGTSSDHLTVYLLEDDFIQYQKDVRKTPSDIDNYNHKNVLRDAINSTWGDRLSDNNIKSGDKFSKEYKYSIPQAADWNPNKLKVLAFIHDNDNTNEIWQCEESKLFPDIE